MATQLGTKGGVFGIPSTGTPFVLNVNGQSHEIIRSYSKSNEADEKEIKNNEGDVVNLTVFNQKSKITVDVILSAATMADALTDFIALPKPGNQATITTADTQVAATSSNEWIVEAASGVATQDDFATMTVTLKRYAAALDPIVT